MFCSLSLKNIKYSLKKYFSSQKAELHAWDALLDVLDRCRVRLHSILLLIATYTSTVSKYVFFNNHASFPLSLSQCVLYVLGLRVVGA